MNQMKYSVRRATDLDQKSWDTFVNAHPKASPYHLFAWKKAIEDSYNHKSYYFIVEKHQQIVGIFPLIHIHLPFMVNELTALPFCDVGNILAHDSIAADLLLKEAGNIIQDTGITTISLRGNMEYHSEKAPEFYPEQTNKVRMLMPLPENSEILMSSFKSKLRSQIRKAEKNGVTFDWEKSENVDRFYEVFTQNMRDLGSPVHSKLWFENILKYYGEYAKMGIVSFENNPIGCCIILSTNNSISIPWASTLRSHNRLAPNMLLYWNVLQFASDNGYSQFDFGRSSEGEGTFKFKKQWGAQPEPLTWYSNKKPQASTVDSQNTKTPGNRERVAQLWSRLPIPMTNYLGPKIRKFISL